MDIRKDRAWLLKEKYQGHESPAFFTDLARLEAGEPLAYVIGTIPFLNCTIHLDSKPLIPRPETEFWVEKAITHIKDRTNLSGVTPTVLDLCAGSGSIGVAVAKALPDAVVTLAEIDSIHLPTIEKNIATNLSVNRKVGVVIGDLYEQITNTFDFILTNPPYIDKEADTVDPGVALHEPHLALFGGEAGIEVIQRIIAGARAKLAPQGELWIEHEPFQAEAIAVLADQHGFCATAHQDQYGTVRYSVLTPAVTK